MRCLAIGLGCLLSLAFASRAWAQAAPATPAQSPEEEAVKRPEPQRISSAVDLQLPEQERLIIPPYMRDRRGNVRTTALFPFYFERKTGESFERLIVPYYYRRGPKLNADVALGLVWSIRGPQRNTFIFPPFYTHRKQNNWALGLFPLFATGLIKGHHHTIIPPLLTWIDGDAKSRHSVFGPVYDWKNEHSRWRGFFPFYWDKAHGVDRFMLVPPIFFRFTEDDPPKTTTVVPPFYYTKRKDEKSWGLIPLAFRTVSPELKSTTVPLALFNYTSGKKEFRLVTPVLSYVRHERIGKLWVTPIYQRRRGEKGMDAVAPFYFRTWDDRDMSKSLVLMPVFWHFHDPANDSLVILPFMGRWFYEGISSTWVVPVVGRYKSFERDEQTWWVAPTLEYGWTENSWRFNIHPIFYRKESPTKSSLAVAPVYFNFENRESNTHRFALAPLWWDFQHYAKNKSTQVAFPLWWSFENGKKKTLRRVGFPLYWDFENRRVQARTVAAFPLYTRWIRGNTERQLVLNSFFEKVKEPGGTRWRFHFFPFFSRGGQGQNRWWNVLGGLAGSDKRGAHRRIKVFWIPFNVK